MPELLPEQPYYFLHTLVGYNDRALGQILLANGREWPDSLYKIDAFLDARPESAQGISEALGLNVREVMATVSKASPATTYYNSYGLVLEGEVAGCYDSDTGKALQKDGTYSEHIFEFTRPSSPEELMDEWYEKFIARKSFTWNEVILAKGAQVVGAFYDPRHKPSQLRTMQGRTQAEEYQLFHDKIEHCGLSVLKIVSKYGVNE